MFDLFRSRAKAMRYLLTALLGLVALSMVITLIPGFGGTPTATRDDILAEVAGDVVTTRMVSQAIQAQIREQQLSPQMAGFVVPQMVDRIVAELATAYQAQNMGFTVSSQELIQMIQTLMPQLFQGGEFAGKEAYRQVLASVNSTIPEFEAKIRQQILLDKLQRLAFDGIIVAPKEIEAEFARRAEKVRLEVIKWDPEEIKKSIKPSREEMLEFLKQNQASFTIPAKRNVALLIADAEQLGSSLPVTDAQLKQAYDSQADRWRVEEKIKVRHILVKFSQNASDDEKKKAKAKADDLLKQIRAGGDFEALAKKNSDDPGSASKGGDLGLLQRGQLVKPFEDRAFSQKLKEIGEPVETVYGYHIIQTMDKQPGRVKPLDEVKPDLLSEFRKRQMFDRMPALAEQARAELVKTPDQAEAVARKFNLKYAKADKVGLGDQYPEIGPNRDLDTALSELQKGGVAPVVQTADNKLIAASVLDIVPTRPAELAEVEDRIREVLASNKARTLAESKARDFEAKLNANSRDFRKAAQLTGDKVIDTGAFERMGQMKEVGHQSMFGEQPFVNPVGSVIGIYRVGTTPYYFKIVEHVLPDKSKIDADRQTIVAIIKERKLRERREMFEEGLVRQLKEKGAIKIFDDNIKRLSASYRG